MKLFPPQKKLLESGMLDSNEHCFICMPTGTGKTFLAEYAIDNAIKDGFKAIYITPLRALASEKYNEFKRRFPNSKVGVFTGETIQKYTTKGSYSSSQILIMTPERLDACMRNWRSHWNWIPDVNLVVIDEFHILGQPQRGPRLEGTITRLIRLNPFVRIIGLSATMPNTNELSEWLQGVSFTSQWRQVPLEKKIVRFKAAKEKPEILLREVHRCIDGGGQSLIFCNSRSRVQSISNYLNENSISAACHHAGLTSDQRASVEFGFKSGTYKAIVATSTLEMGLNLPARQVVIYDSYTYSETGFEPLPVWSFIQRGGRAGRPGLDSTGEVILMLPRWSGDANKYVRGKCEDINSLLKSQKAMQEQILIDVYAGYSRTREELTNGFLPMTLYKKQHPEASIHAAINKLVLSDLLIETCGTPDDPSEHILRCGLLGRMSVKLMFAPESIKLIKDAYKGFDRLYLFDLLLIAAMTEDCSPVLQANYEEMDTLCETVQCLHSTLLDLPIDRLKRKLHDSPSTSRILASLKMAAICHCLTEGTDVNDLAERFDVFPADIRLLQESVVRILSGITAITGAIDKSEKGEEYVVTHKSDASSVPNLSSMLANMLKYEISSELVTLTKLQGVGGKTAKRLSESGFSTMESIAEASPDQLSKVPSVGAKLAESLVIQALELLKDSPETFYSEAPYSFTGETRNVKIKIDPYRLRRSLELSIKGSDRPKYCVTGGREDHIVIASDGQFTCDCMDFEKNEGNCKHILCVQRSLGDPEVCRMVKRIKEDKNHTIRESLPSLWYSVTTTERES